MKTSPADAGKHVVVPRYSGSARINHWTVACTFVLLMVSGLALFSPDLYFLSALFGGGANMAWLHPWLGVILSISFLGLFLRFAIANLPERGDGKWLVSVKSVLTGHEESLPEVGKYNAGQKVMFWVQTLLVVVMLISGLTLWSDGRAVVETLLGSKLSIDTQRLMAIVHASAAVASILMWILHVYAAIWVRGTLSAMTRGFVTGGWAWRHHRKWLRQVVSNRGSRQQS